MRLTKQREGECANQFMRMGFASDAAWRAMLIESLDAPSQVVLASAVTRSRGESKRGNQGLCLNGEAAPIDTRPKHWIIVAVAAAAVGIGVACYENTLCIIYARRGVHRGTLDRKSETC